jgi:ankyrin repeat protein
MNTLPPLFVEATSANDLFQASREGDLDAIKAHIEIKGASALASDGEGRSPLHWAAACGQLAAVQYLLDRGAPAHTVDEDGKKVAGS